MPELKIRNEDPSAAPPQPKVGVSNETFDIAVK